MTGRIPCGGRQGRKSVRVSLAPSAAGAGLDPIVIDADAPGSARLDWLDEERARLRPGAGAAATAVRLLPPVPAPGTPGVRRREVIVDGWRVEVEVEPSDRAALRERARRGRIEVGHSGSTDVRAIIPGVVRSVAVTVGDSVVAGQEIAIVEAMKMQNELRAPRAGTVQRVAVAAGETIELGDLVVVLGRPSLEDT